ncbi:hypothetical protein HC928_22315, partial [bacterium]|nr:hypothetical protein [bacterium]
MDLLTLTRFDQSVLNMALVHLCDRQSHVGMEMRRLYASQQEETDEAVYN